MDSITTKRKTFICLSETKQNNSGSKKKVDNKNRKRHRRCKT